MPLDELKKLSAAFGVKPEPKTQPTNADGDESVARVVDDELARLGYPAPARLSALGDVGRENGWNRSIIFGGHADPKNKALNRGIISWQGTRRTGLDASLEREGVLGRGDDDELRGMVRFMDSEMQRDFPQVYAKLKGARTTAEASEALRQYIKYVPTAPYNAPDSEFGVQNNREWATKARDLGLGTDAMPLADLSKAFSDAPQSDFKSLSTAFEPVAAPDDPKPLSTAGKPFMSPAEVGMDTPDGEKAALLSTRKAISEELKRARTAPRRKILIERLKKIDSDLLLLEQRTRAEAAVSQNTPIGTQKPEIVPPEGQIVSPEPQIVTLGGLEGAQPEPTVAPMTVPGELQYGDPRQQAPRRYVAEEPKVGEVDLPAAVRKTTGGRSNAAVTSAVQLAPAPPKGKPQAESGPSVSFSMIIPKDADRRTSIAEQIHQKLADNGIEATREDVTSAISELGWVQSGTKNKADEFDMPRGEQIDITIDETFVRTVAKAQATREAREKETGRRLGEYSNKVEEYRKQLGADDPISLANLRAARDLGLIDDTELAKREAEERDLATRLRAEGRAGLSSIDRGRAFGEEPETPEAKASRVKSSENDYLANIFSEHATLADYKKEQDRLKEEYKYRGLAHPIEFAKNFYAAVPKAVASMLKSADIARNLLSPNVMSPFAEVKMEESVLTDLGDSINNYVEDQKNKDIKGFWVTTFPDTLGQLGVQMAGGVITKGATLPTLIGASMGAAAQYDEAKNLNATDRQKLAAAVVGGLAAVPDAILFRKWFKGASDADQAGFFKKLSQSLLARLGVKYGDDVAREVVESATPRVAMNVLKSTGFEGSQELGENKVNKWFAGEGKIPGLNIRVGAGYDLSEETLKKADPFTWTEEDVVSFIAGSIGGGVAQVVTSFADRGPEFSNSVADKLNEMLASGEITREQAGQVMTTLAQEVGKQKKKKGEPAKAIEPVVSEPIAEKPTSVEGQKDATPEAKPEFVPDYEDKKGNKYELVENRGDKILVKDEGGVITQRNANRLTPVPGVEIKDGEPAYAGETEQQIKERRKFERQTSEIIPEQVHNLAKDKELNPDSPEFQEASKKLTGKAHLDDMTPDELRTVTNAITNGSIEKPVRDFDIVKPAKPAKPFKVQGIQLSKRNGNEAEPKATPFSNTQIDLSPEQAKPIEDFKSKVIDPKDIADKVDLPPYANDGITFEPHVTVKYGLHTNAAADIAPLLEGEGPIEIELGKVAAFYGDERATPYDVVVVEVKSPDLHRLNAKISKGTKVTDTFPEYKPHLTLAYVKKGMGTRYADRTDFEGQKFTFDGVKFSPADKSGKTDISLGQSKEPEQIINPAAGNTIADLSRRKRENAEPAPSTRPIQAGSTVRVNGENWQVQEVNNDGSVQAVTNSRSSVMRLDNKTLQRAGYTTKEVEPEPAAAKPAASTADIFDNALAELYEDEKPATAAKDEYDDIASIMGFEPATFKSVISLEQEVDETKHAALAPVFEKAIDRFTDVGDPAEKMRSFLKTLKERFTLDQIAQLKPYIVRFIEEKALQSDEKGSIKKVDDTDRDTEADPGSREREQGRADAELDAEKLAGGQDEPRTARPERGTLVLKNGDRVVGQSLFMEEASENPTLTGVIKRIRNMVDRLEESRDIADKQLARLTNEYESAKGQAQAEFPKAAELADMKKRHAELLNELRAKRAKKPVAAETVEEPDTLKSVAERDISDIFYSQVERTIDQKMPNRASAAHVRGILKDARQEERDWLGIDEFLNSKAVFAKDEVLAYVRANNIRIEEVEKSGEDVQFGPEKRPDLTVGGGKGYRELILKLPVRSDLNYEDPHFRELNTIGHLRFNERNLDGLRLMHIAEAQADIVNEIRRLETRIAENAEKTDDRERLAFLKDLMPFKKSWPMLLMKRAIRYAIDNGYDGLSWDTGETNALRSDLRQDIEAISFDTDDGVKIVAVTLKEGMIVEFALDENNRVHKSSVDAMEGQRIDQAFGKEIARQILDQPSGHVTGDGLTMGGEGKTGLYDRILPNETNKYVRTWGAKVESAQILNYDPAQGELRPEIIDAGEHLTPVHSLLFTPAMRHSAVTEGQRLFKKLTDEMSEEDRMTFEQMKALPYVEFDELLTEAEATRFGGLIKANAYSHEIYRRTFEEARIREGKAKRGGKDIEDLFAGVFLKPETIAGTIDILREKAAEAKELGYAADEVAVFDDHVKMLEDAATEGDGTVVIYIFDSALPQELFHQADYLGAGEKTILNRHTDEYKKVLDEHYIVSVLWAKHYSKFNEYTRIKNNSVLKAVLRAEIAPHLLELSDSELADLGITPDQRDDYLLKWFEGYAAKNGIESLDYFDKDELDVHTFIDQIKSADTRNDSGPIHQKDETKDGRQTTDQKGKAREGPGVSQRTSTRKVDPDAFGDDAAEYFQLGEGEKFASLPATLRRAGLEVDPLVYQIFRDKAAIAEAERLFNELNIPGSIKLLRNIKGAEQDVHHAILAFMVQRALLDHAVAIEQMNPQAAEEARTLARTVGREQTLTSLGAGRWIRAASIIDHSLEHFLSAVDAVVSDKYGEDKTLSPEEWARVEAVGREAEEAFVENVALEKEKQWLQRKLKRLESELDGTRKKRRAPSSQKARTQLADLVRASKASHVEIVKQRILARLGEPASLETEPMTLKSVMDAGDFDETMLDELAEVGALMLSEGLAGQEEYLPEDFHAEMVATFGDSIRPHFQEIYMRSWNLRNVWLNEIRAEQTKEHIENKYGDELEDWEIDEILGVAKERARRRRAIETMHRLVSGGKGRAKNNIADYKRLISGLAESDDVAIAGILIAENIGVSEIYRQLEDLGITDAAAQREAIRKGKAAYEKAKIELQIEKDSIANELLANERALGQIDDLRWKARQRAETTQRAVAHELRRIKEGEFWYRTGQVMNIANAMRTMMASLDMSGSMRQGGWFSFAAPEQQARAFADMFASITDANYGRVIQTIENDALFTLAQRSGVAFAVAGRRDDESGEELFRGEETIEKIPMLGPLVAKYIVKPSERTYSAFLDTQRMVMFRLFAEELMASGLSFRRNKREFEKIAEFVSVATGRGTMPRNRYAKLLMELPLFAPRYTLSRLQLLNMTLNPVAYYHMPGAARKIVAKSAMRFYGTTGTIMALAAAAGLTSLDDDDDDFLKIKIGNARYDIFAGTLQPAKVIIKMIHSAIRTKAGTDDRIDGEFFWDTLYALGRFGRGKLSPSGSLAVDIGIGTDFIGEKTQLLTDVKGVPVPGKAIWSRLIPLSIGDMIQSGTVDGPLGIAKSAPFAWFGIGVSTYKAKLEKPETEAEKLAAKMTAWRMKGKSKLEKEQRDLKNELIARSRMGEDVSAQVDALVKAGTFGDYHKAEILSAAGKTLLEDKAEGLSLDEIEIVLRMADDKERKILLPLLNEKMKNADVGRKLTPEQRDRLEKAGAKITGDFPMPAAVKEAFDTLGIKTPDAGESLTLKKGEDKTKLTSEQYDKYRREILEEIYSRVENTLKSPAYLNADSTKRRKLIEGQIRKGRAAEQQETKRDLRK